MEIATALIIRRVLRHGVRHGTTRCSVIGVKKFDNHPSSRSINLCNQPREKSQFFVWQRVCPRNCETSSLARRRSGVHNRRFTLNDKVYFLDVEDRPRRYLDPAGEQYLPLIRCQSVAFSAANDSSPPLVTRSGHAGRENRESFRRARLAARDPGHAGYGTIAIILNLRSTALPFLIRAETRPSAYVDLGGESGRKCIYFCRVAGNRRENEIGPARWLV